MKNIKLLRDRQKVIETLDNQEIEKLITIMRNDRTFVSFRNEVILLVFLDTGIRLSELVGIEVEDVATNHIVIRKTKNLYQRIVYLSERTQEQLRKYLVIRGDIEETADYSKNLLARRAGKTVEKSILVGLGGDEFAGIVPDADVQSVDVVGTATLEDLQELYLKVHPEFLAGASFTMSRDFFNQIAKLKDANGHYYVQMGTVNGKIQYVLFGMQVDVTDALPAATPAVFGNIAEAYAIMIKQEAGIQEIVDSGLALKGAKLYVYDAFMDGAVVNPAAVVKLNVAQA